MCITCGVEWCPTLTVLGGVSKQRLLIPDLLLLHKTLTSRAMQNTTFTLSFELEDKILASAS